MEGAGVTVLPEISIKREIEEGTLTRLAWEQNSYEVAVLMIRLKGKWMSPTLRAFMEATRTVLKSSNAMDSDEQTNEHLLDEKTGVLGSATTAH
jgi:DNA-binding transcriptional LysR family regulator